MPLDDVGRIVDLREVLVSGRDGDIRPSVAWLCGLRMRLRDAGSVSLTDSSWRCVVSAVEGEDALTVYHTERPIPAITRGLDEDGSVVGEDGRKSTVVAVRSVLL